MQSDTEDADCFIHVFYVTEDLTYPAADHALFATVHR